MAAQETPSLHGHALALTQEGESLNRRWVYLEGQNAEASHNRGEEGGGGGGCRRGCWGGGGVPKKKWF